MGGLVAPCCCAFTASSPHHCIRFRPEPGVGVLTRQPTGTALGHRESSWWIRTALLGLSGIRSFPRLPAVVPLCTAIHKGVGASNETFPSPIRKDV